MTLAEVAAQAEQPEGTVALVLTGLAARGLAGAQGDRYWKTAPGEPPPVVVAEPVRVVANTAIPSGRGHVYRRPVEGR